MLLVTCNLNILPYIINYDRYPCITDTSTVAVHVVIKMDSITYGL